MIKEVKIRFAVLSGVQKSQALKLFPKATKDTRFIVDRTGKVLRKFPIYDTVEPKRN